MQVERKNKALSSALPKDFHIYLLITVAEEALEGERVLETLEERDQLLVFFCILKSKQVTYYIDPVTYLRKCGDINIYAVHWMKDNDMV
ncbi:hypothetical protein AAC387_Pa01g3006 [Persea americana]